MFFQDVRDKRNLRLFDQLVLRKSRGHDKHSGSDLLAYKFPLVLKDKPTGAIFDAEYRSTNTFAELDHPLVTALVPQLLAHNRIWRVVVYPDMLRIYLHGEEIVSDHRHIWPIIEAACKEYYSQVISRKA